MNPHICRGFASVAILSLAGLTQTAAEAKSKGMEPTG
jgi:hypothetical protein